LVAEREEKKSSRDAIFQACLLRFRPILMTTMAAALGAMPLVISAGTGSELPPSLGITIVGGLIVSQILTLYTTPVVYLYLDRLRLWWARMRAKPDAMVEPALMKERTRYCMRTKSPKLQAPSFREIPNTKHQGLSPSRLKFGFGASLVFGHWCLELLFLLVAASRRSIHSLQFNAVAFKETNGWKVRSRKKTHFVASGGNIQRHQPEHARRTSRASNQTVAVAFANFLAARAVVKQRVRSFFPIITASPSVTRSRQSASRNQLSSSSSTKSSSANARRSQNTHCPSTHRGTGFLGRIRNTVQANSREAEATLADLENVRLSIHAELAADYFQLRALEAQKHLFDAAMLAYQESLKLTQVRHDTGIASDQDVAQAETQLNTTAAQATDIAIQRAQLEHAIALLVGQPASTFSIATELLMQIHGGSVGHSVAVA